MCQTHAFTQLVHAIKLWPLWASLQPKPGRSRGVNRASARRKLRAADHAETHERTPRSQRLLVFRLWLYWLGSSRIGVMKPQWIGQTEGLSHASAKGGVQDSFTHKDNYLTCTPDPWAHWFPSASTHQCDWAALAWRRPDPWAHWFPSASTHQCDWAALAWRRPALWACGKWCRAVRISQGAVELRGSGSQALILSWTGNPHSTPVYLSVTDFLPVEYIFQQCSKDAANHLGTLHVTFPCIK